MLRRIINRIEQAKGRLGIDPYPLDRVGQIRNRPNVRRLRSRHLDTPHPERLGQIGNRPTYQHQDSVGRGLAAQCGSIFNVPDH